MWGGGGGRGGNSVVLVGKEVPDEYGVSTADDSAAIRGEAELSYGLRVADENLPREGKKEWQIIAGGEGGRKFIVRVQDVSIRVIKNI